MSIDPKILKRMQGEDTFLQSQTRGSRRVKLNRGQNWIVRFLPAQLGPDGMFFARIARHWLNKLPIVCPRNTAADYGGIPDCDCPVCDLAEELNESADQVISKFGYSARSNPQFLTYCIVWEKDGIQQPMSEVINPYEFWHYRSTWEELKGFYIAGGRRCPDSVLDYKLGNDFSVSKTAKGMRLDKLDSSPIFDKDEPKYAEWIKKIEAALRTPKVVIPTHEQLQVFAAKVQEAANRGGAAEDEPRRGRRQPDAESEDEDFRPRRRAPVDEEPQPRRRAPVEGEDDGDLGPVRPKARRPEADARPEDEYDAPRRRAPVEAEAEEPQPRRRAPAAEEEPQPRRRAPVEAEAEEPPAPRRRPVEAEEEPQPRRRTAPVEPDEEPAPRRRATAPVDEDPQPRRRTASAAEAEAEPEPRTRSRREEPEPVTGEGDGEPVAENDPEPVATNTRLPATQRRALEPTARRTAAPKEAAGSPQGDAEEDDPLPEDDTDPAPPAPKVDAEDAPPPVARKGSQAGDIKDRLKKLGREA